VASVEEADFLVDIKVSEESPYQRFTFDIELGEGQSGELQDYVLKVLATPGVEIGVRYSYSPSIASKIVDLYWQTRDGNDLSLVPPPGIPLDVDYLASVARLLDNDDPQFSRRLWDEYLMAIGVVKFLGQLGVDVGIGMIPIVGDGVDIVEFAGSFVTGTDKWGQPVTNFDRLLMAGGILLPFVSSGALRALGRAVP
jgi:hypothetical protein